jgi:RND family efflux transporter MFP subunit
MRNTESESAEESLRRENLELKRKLQELQTPHSDLPARMWQPSGTTIWAIFLGVTVLVIVAFFAGYLPLQKRRAVIAAESQDQQQALPRVEVIEVGRSSQKTELELPANIEAVTEAPILARADGYLLHRMVDIGDRVKAGQLLAEIEAPELDEQVQQAKANLDQARAGLDQALANYEQGKASTDLAKVTAERWSSLSARGVVSRQENDQYQAGYRTQVAALQSLEKAIAAQKSNIAAAEANLARLQKMQGYRMVKAPFDGVITMRNVDTGALVNAGNTMMFRIGQTGTLRTYVNVPQMHAGSIHVGQTARLTVTNIPGRQFAGTVARTANSLDPNTRTLLVEVHVPNGDGALLPGMYAQVNFSSTRVDPPLLVPSVALISRGDGPRVAVVTANHTVHLQPIQVGRDFGDRLEVLSGLREGDTIIPNPGDAATEGLKVEPVVAAGTRGTPGIK